MSNIENWKNVLAWKTIPEFRSIHSLDEKRFVGCYYLPETINEFIDKIKNSIIDGYGFNHKTIIGDPGTGKTTFIYYLRSALKEGGNDGGLHMEILHVQRLVTNGDFETVIEDRVKKILGKYFAAIGLQSIFESLTKDAKNDKIAINNLEDYIVENKASLKKKLVVVVDDVDETSEQVVDAALRYFYSLVECEQISKWLIARATTLNNYGEELINFIETKFPQRLVFPKVDLFGIIDKRIKFDNPEGANPFIPELCHQMLAAHNNDLRVSVANALAFLENLKPPATSKNNPLFAGNYLVKNFTKVMTEIGVFPNIYLDSVSKTVPIEKDVFLIIAATNRFDGKNLAALEQHYRRVYEGIHSKAYVAESYLINLDMDHVNEAVSMLKNNRLIMEHQRIKGFYKLTPKGESFVRFVNEQLYTRRAEEASIKNDEKKHRVFWDLATMHPEYEVDLKLSTPSGGSVKPRGRT